MDRIRTLLAVGCCALLICISDSSAGVRLDYAGLSYFPTSSDKDSERSFDYLRTQADAIFNALHEPIFNCETGYPDAPRRRCSLNNAVDRAGPQAPCLHQELIHRRDAESAAMRRALEHGNAVRCGFDWTGRIPMLRNAGILPAQKKS